MENEILLLKTLLLSTSQRNIYKYCRDKKKRSKIIGNMVGTAVLYLLLMGYCVLTCVGYGLIGIIHTVPVMCALTISLLAFMFTLIKTNGYLFNFKEYDMLMALPFESKSVAGSRFLYMYIKSLPWYLSIAVAMLIGYGIYASPAWYVYPLWLILSLFLPLIPMLAAAFLGFLIARISSGFRKTNIIQTVLTITLAILAFFLRFIIEALFRNNQIEYTLETISGMMDSAAVKYPPAGWFADAVTKHSLSSALLLTGVSILLFTIVFRIVGRSYRTINSALRSHAASRNYRMSSLKKHSVLNAIAFKEFKRMTGSPVYMTNGGLGMILAALLGIITLIFGFDRITAIVTSGAMTDSSVLQPAIPFIIHLFIGMEATTACSPSLEGKNYWIVQSLPIDRKTLYRGKMLFNMYLAVPFMTFATLCMCVSARVPVLNTVLYLILGFTLCAFSTAWGCVCGVKHMRLDWENEIEVVKQGTAVTLYLLPNMFAVMILVFLMVILGLRMNHQLLALIMILAASVLAALSYLKVMAFARRGL